MRNLYYNPLPEVLYAASGSKIRKFQDSGTFRDWKKANWNADTSREQKQYDRLSARIQTHGADTPVGAMAQSKLNKLSTSSNITNTSATMSNLHMTNTGKSLQNMVKPGAGGGGSIMSMAADAAAGIINQHSKVDESEGQKMAKSAITNAISMIPGWGTAAAAALKVADAIGNATGTNLDSMNKNQAKAAGVSSWARVANNVMGALPANFLGLATGDTMDAYNTKDVQELSDAFAGTADDVNTASTMGGKSYLFGKRKANQFITQSNRNVDLLTSLNQTNSLRKKATGEQFDMQNQNIYSGRSMGGDRTYVGRNGLKLMSAQEAKQLVESMKFHDSFVKQFQNGGVIGVDTNILPEGALHRNLNHLEEANAEVGEEVTTKGIPVIVTDENCNIKQVAEIEKEEIILRKAITDKIESYWKDGSEEAMILAGKLLANEIITNTQDNTGQLEESNNEQQQI